MPCMLHLYEGASDWRQALLKVLVNQVSENKKHYILRRQYIEKPSIIPGCPV